MRTIAKGFVAGVFTLAKRNSLGLGDLYGLGEKSVPAWEPSQ